MRTDDLIAVLARDARPAQGAVGRALGAAVLTALAGSIVVMMAGWGPRPHLAQALATGPFWMKAGYTAAVAIAGLLLIERLGRPGVSGRRGWLALSIPVAVIAALAIRELSALPHDQWAAAILGQTWDRCPLRIAVISIPAFIAALWALRRMAPTRPRLAGAAAGLMAGGIGASVYGLNCQETAAAFTAVWYTLGMLVWAAVGAALGGRLLRW
ncbi:MAG TPA: DUF1109 domain-containing protein [Caulobacteraceae bacterium]|nr:DUF1109 domain-containing protein [Caulobacteraceae bacterium]